MIREWRTPENLPRSMEGRAADVAYWTPALKTWRVYTSCEVREGEFWWEGVVLSTPDRCTESSGLPTEP